MIASAVVFGVGFGTAYPVFVAYVMQHVDQHRRGAAFGAILAAFDTGHRHRLDEWPDISSDGTGSAWPSAPRPRSRPSRFRIS